MRPLVEYQAASFGTGAASYAAQGRCSWCDEHRWASWMNHKQTHAWCDECKAKREVTEV